MRLPMIKAQRQTGTSQAKLAQLQMGAMSISPVRPLALRPIHPEHAVLQMLLL